MRGNGLSARGWLQACVAAIAVACALLGSSTASAGSARPTSPASAAPTSTVPAGTSPSSPAGTAPSSLVSEAPVSPAGDTPTSSSDNATASVESVEREGGQPGERRRVWRL